MATEIVLDGPEGLELGLDVHGVYALEGLLLARYHMFQQVYFHKTPPAFESYLGGGVGGRSPETTFSSRCISKKPRRPSSITSSARWPRARSNCLCRADWLIWSS